MSAAAADAILDFTVPAALEAGEPPEARGVARDQVRLLVSSGTRPDIEHVRFRALPRFLRPGDVLVVNTSATIPAALAAWRKYERIALHVASPHPEGGWIVELRRMAEKGTTPLRDASAGERVRLPGGAEATLVGARTRFLIQQPGLRCTAQDAFRPGFRPDAWLKGSNGRGMWNKEPGPPSVRLWRAIVRGTGDMLSYLDRYGSPIAYGYVRRPWPLGYYQTVFAREPGSAEMPSAGRAFSQALVARLRREGVRIAPIVLHTGVASLEADEPLYPERFRVPRETAQRVNSARDAGDRVIAVGTTAVRALETVADPTGRVHAGEGWTDLAVTPERGLYAVDGILTGFHEPRASHLSMLQALVGREHVARAYDAALEHRYLWHEFGDVHLLLTSSTTSTGR